MVPQKVRPTFLLAEPSPGEALSTRKLVIETAKFNVITAHWDSEAIELLRKFPYMDAVILHTALEGFRRVAESVKSSSQTMPLILLQPNTAEDGVPADHRLSSHSPEDLVALLRSEFGDPRI